MTEASVYLVTGDDYLDDPAWGIAPVWSGDIAATASWLLTKPNLDELAVSVDHGPTVWARDFLKTTA